MCACTCTCTCIVKFDSKVSMKDDRDELVVHIVVVVGSLIPPLPCLGQASSGRRAPK